MLLTFILTPFYWLWGIAKKYPFGELSLPATTAISIGIFLIINYLLVVFEFFLHLMSIPNQGIVIAKSSLLFAVLSLIHVAVWLSSESSYRLLKLGVRLLVINNSIVALVFLLSAYGFVVVNQKSYIPNPNVPRLSLH